MRRTLIRDGRSANIKIVWLSEECRIPGRSLGSQTGVNCFFASICEETWVNPWNTCLESLGTLVCNPFSLSHSTPDALDCKHSCFHQGRPCISRAGLWAEPCNIVKMNCEKISHTAVPKTSWCWVEENCAEPNKMYCPAEWIYAWIITENIWIHRNFEYLWASCENQTSILLSFGISTQEADFKPNKHALNLQLLPDLNTHW